jgi:hypothetical protein
MKATEAKLLDFLRKSPRRLSNVMSQSPLSQTDQSITRGEVAFVQRRWVTAFTRSAGGER